MALMNCPECGKEISDKAHSCPNCGMPIAKQTTRTIETSTQSQSQDIIHCPKCHSTNLHVDKKGYSGGKALAGAITFGGLGLLTGTIGSGNIVVTCLSCGHKFNPIKEKQKKETEQFTNEHPWSSAVAGLSGALAFMLLFVKGVSFWWSVIIPVCGIIIAVIISSNKKK